MSMMIEDSILSLSHEEARTHLLKGKSYSTIGLPPHFKFDSLLGEVQGILQQFPAKELYKKFLKANPGNEEEINYSLFQNKDSRYAWRRFQLINPILYVALVLHITEKSAWGTICERFKKFSAGAVECTGLPLKSLAESSPLYWWRRVEQRSIELSLQFEHMLTADIANCYDSIYTHSLAWALHTKETAKGHRGPKEYQYIGNVIDWHLQAMNHQQTNGIPTGSVLMNLIAEMVLGYMDLELTKKLVGRDIKDYHILRHRDDYRIFVRNSATGAEIMRVLTEVAISLGLQLNAGKTRTSDNIINASMKDDKIAWITRKQRQEPRRKPKNEERRKRQVEAMMFKNLLIIHNHGCQFPNAGSLVGAMKEYQRELKRRQGNIRLPAAGVLASVVVDIAHRNPLRQRPCAALLSKLLSLPSVKEDREYQLGFWQRIQAGLRRLPNTGYLETWLQRFTVPQELPAEYEVEICKLVDHLRGGKPAPPPILWNVGWVGKIREELTSLEYGSIVDLENLNKARATIPLSEAYPSSDEYEDLV